MKNTAQVLGMEGPIGSGQPSQVVPWTSEQGRVIRADATERLLVDAGPGTGKTAVACARIAWLIDSGSADAARIWLISFTRTAVHELRSRIAAHLKDPTAAYGLRIATIDSHAWAIHSGFDTAARLSGSFDSNIDDVIRLVRQNDGVFEYLGSVQHLLVDEAQDIIGSRCELLLEIIHALPEDTGITVLSDEAQAIYTFGEKERASEIEGHLPQCIRRYLPEFRVLDLTEIHRTSDPVLTALFEGGRGAVRAGSTGPERYGRVRSLIESTNHSHVGSFRSDFPGLADEIDDALLLFRRRGEALDASGYLAQRPHRLRMSGLPACIHAWVALILWDWASDEIDNPEFLRRWSARVSSDSEDCERAWNNLVRFFGQSPTRISVQRLVDRLASGSPPYPFTTPDFGMTGPIVGTVHGSKGREAEEVRLYLPSAPLDSAEDARFGEEARVLFVGATRARTALRVGKGSAKPSRRLKSSGRAFTTSYSKQKVQVEIGRHGDIDSCGLAGNQLYPSVNCVKAAQRALLDLSSDVRQLRASVSGPELDWRYKLSLEGSDAALCYLSTALNNDLFGIASTLELGRVKPPAYFKHIRTLGVRTLAISRDDPDRERLHPPWRDSGLMLAPLVIGYPQTYFQHVRRKR